MLFKTFIVIQPPHLLNLYAEIGIEKNWNIIKKMNISMHFPMY
jgi:hypothetical protein